jgi:hypothetical protein
MVSSKLADKGRLLDPQVNLLGRLLDWKAILQLGVVVIGPHFGMGCSARLIVFGQLKELA